MFERGDLIHLPPLDQPGEGGGFWSENWGVILVCPECPRRYLVRWVSGDETWVSMDWTHEHCEIVSKA